MAPSYSATTIKYAKTGELSLPRRARTHAPTHPRTPREPSPLRPPPCARSERDGVRRQRGGRAARLRRAHRRLCPLRPLPTRLPLHETAARCSTVWRVHRVHATDARCGRKRAWRPAADASGPFERARGQQQPCAHCSGGAHHPTRLRQGRAESYEYALEREMRRAVVDDRVLLSRFRMPVCIPACRVPRL